MKPGFESATYIYMTQFEIECRCGRHSVTKKFMTILQKLNNGKIYIFISNTFLM